jgi:hypothetical protein
VKKRLRASMMDTSHGEMVEAELDNFIELRHDQRVKTEGERREEELWSASEREYDLN